MPKTKFSLRDLATAIEAVGRTHPAWGQVSRIVYNCTEHIAAVARVAEINQDDARPVQVLLFTYTNYRNEVSERHVNPLSIRWGTSEWYPHPQWLLMCWDLDKQDRREFAIARMSLVKQQDRSGSVSALVAERECAHCGLLTDFPEGSGACPVYFMTNEGYCPLFVDGNTREQQKALGLNGGPEIA